MPESNTDARKGGPALLRDVAKAAGVSPMTASRAINNQGRVAPETRERVLAEAERLGYRPSFSARSLRSSESRLIGFIAPNFMLPVHVEIIQGVREVARNAGYRLVLQADPDAYSGPLMTDGDLVIDFSQLPDDWQKPDPMRTVGLMSRMQDPTIDICASDIVGATIDAVRFLRAKGYRRIGQLQRIVVPTPDFIAQALEEYGIENDPQLVQHATDDRQSILDALHALMSLPEPPDALAIIHVAGTPVVLRELHAHQIVIGRDIGFIGSEVNSSSWGDLVSPRMSAIRIPAYQVGTIGATRLIARLQGDDSPPRRYEFPAELIERESTPGPWMSPR